MVIDEIPNHSNCSAFNGTGRVLIALYLMTTGANLPRLFTVLLIKSKSHFTQVSGFMVEVSGVYGRSRILLQSNEVFL